MPDVRFKNIGNSKSLKTGLLVLFFLFSSLSLSFAEEIKIIFTGQAYASLYPCACPHEPDGGIARRATLIKKARLANRSVVVLEAGASFASGPHDPSSQNYDTDSRRTEAYLGGLRQMGYDALLVSSQEFVFGNDFLARFLDLPFVSSNSDATLRPYVIRDLGWIKVGILGLTDAAALSKGAAKWQDPRSVLEGRVAELKKKGVALIVLLSALSPKDDRELLRNIKGIDLVINASPFLGSVELTEEGDTAYVSTWWQARRVGILTLEISGSKVIKRTLESPRLDKEIADDKDILSFLPACVRDSDCQAMPGMMGTCEASGTGGARCVYTALPKLSLTVIKPQVCRTCRVEEVIGNLKKSLGDLKVTYLSNEAPAALEIIREFNLTMLPAYVFAGDVEKTGVFSAISESLQKGLGRYLLKPSHAGVSYILGRNEIQGRLDIFFDLQSSGSAELFALLKRFCEKHRDTDCRINFLAWHDKNGEVTSQGRIPEIEEFGRIACIDDMRHRKVFDYLICRASGKQSTWWEACATQTGLDPARIKDCALSTTGSRALDRRVFLTEELRIAAGPTFLVDNTEIFSVVQTPSLEEFEAAVFGVPQEKSRNKK